MTAPVYDVAVIGAGPAGLAAATTLAPLGLSTVVFDAASAPGGQVYRAITTSPVRRRAILGREYWRGAELVREFLESGATYRPSASVWAMARRDDGVHELAVQGSVQLASVSGIHAARALILATGAVERPFPIPGWTLPGVFAAGGMQALLKSSALVPSGRVVLAGSGPLLWLAAWQGLRAGAAIECLLETVPRGRLAKVLWHAPEFLLSGYFRRGLEIVREVRRSVRVIDHVDAIHAMGEVRLTGVRYSRDGSWHEQHADTLVLSHGVVPQLDAASALGCELRWNDAQACFEPALDEWGGTSIEGVWIAGDAGGIAGADAAAARGSLAALAVANALGRIGAGRRDREAVRPRRALDHALRGRAFLDALYRPPAAFRRPDGDTLVCRCEEASARDVRAAARATNGALGEVKAWTRCGMGACQGRMCALTLSELCAEARGVSPAGVGHVRARFPLQPVPLAEVAGWPGTAAADRAVSR